MDKTWGDIYWLHIRRGEDHGYAAWMADQYENWKRTEAAIMPEMEE